MTMLQEVEFVIAVLAFGCSDAVQAMAAIVTAWFEKTFDTYFNHDFT